MVSPRRLVLVALVLVLHLTAAAEPPSGEKQPAAPTKEQVRDWIVQLGDDDFDKREQASQKLWEAGETAEEAVKAATKSTDAEVARRAGELFDKFKWGVYPSTPAPLVALLGRYQETEPRTRRSLVVEFMKHGPAGCRILFKILATEENNDLKDGITRQMAEQLPVALLLFVGEKDQPLLEKIIELGVKAGNSTGIRNAAGYWLAHGRLEERIQHYQSLEARKKNPEENAEILAYLLRAAGKSAAALDAARRSGKPELLDALLAETGNWKELATKDSVYLDFIARHSSKLSHKAAYNRLAGNEIAYEKAVKELVAEDKKDGVAEKELLARSQELLLLDKPKEALELLLRKEDNWDTAFELLTTQFRFREAFQLVERARKANPGPWQQVLLLKLECLEAQLLFGLGEKDAARKQFALLSTRKIDLFPRDTIVEMIVEAEIRAGLVEEAFQHAGTILGGGPGLPWLTPLLFNNLFSHQASKAKAVWFVLGKLFPEEEGHAQLKRLRDVMGGKMTAKEVAEWAKKVEALANLPLSKEALEAPFCWPGMAEIAVFSGQEELGRGFLLKAGTSPALLRLADLLAAAKQWDKAAERYYQAWEKDRTQAIALYLSGKALVKAGKAQEGKVRQEQAQVLPLGNESLRADLCDELARRGETEALRQAIDLQLKLCDPNSYDYGDALRKLSLLPESQTDPMKQADLQERSLLRMFREGISFRMPAAYLVVPATIHRQRALGLLAAGKTSAASAEISRCQEYLPGNVELVIALTSALEKAGQQREAEALFERSLRIHESVIKDYPRCAWAHNSIAWMSACCHRDLDTALKHAEQAVELAPKSAGHLDTLAEVLFQQGQQKKAIETEKRVIALDPARQYYRKQLQRIEAGNPKAPLPPEDDD